MYVHVRFCYYFYLKKTLGVFGVVNANVNVCRLPCCTSRAALARVRAATLRHVSSLRYAAVRHVMLRYGSEMTSFSVVPDHFRSTSGSLPLTSGSYDVISGVSRPLPVDIQAF